MAARAVILATVYSRHAPKAQNGLSDTPTDIEQGGAFRLVRHGDHVRMSFLAPKVTSLRARMHAFLIFLNFFNS